MPQNFTEPEYQLGRESNLRVMIASGPFPFRIVKSQQLNSVAIQFRLGFLIIYEACFHE